MNAGELITGALRLIGVVAEGEDPSAETMIDSMSVFNMMLDSWSTERLAVYSTQDQTFTWPANTVSSTIGPSGDFVGNRPVALDDSTYFNDPGTGVSYPISVINQEQYDNIALKSATSTFPRVIWLNMDMPNASMYLYPVPTRALEFHFISVTELTQVVGTDDTITLPPGYLRALRYNLACELAAEFGMEPPNMVQRLANVAKRTIKRQNAPMDVMGMPWQIVSKRNRFNIYAGQ